MSLIEALTQQLGVSNEQAQGGAGLLLQVAQQQLGSGDFDSLKALIPDDLEALLGAAPSAAAGGGEGVMGMIGAAAEALGMGETIDKLGGLAALTQGFEQLGLDSEMVTKFISAVMEFLKSQGGEQVVAALQSVLK